MRILFLFPVLLSFLAISSAQIQNYTWMPVTDNLTGITVSPSGNIALCGSGGTVLLSSDKGTTWHQSYTGSGTDLQGIFYQNDSVCVIVGHNETILHSTNGGRSWKRNNIPNLNNINSAASKGNTIIATTDSGYICRSTDFGQTWNIVQQLGFLSNPKIVAISNGWVAGSTNGQLWYSTDDGLVWETGALDKQCNSCRVKCIRQDVDGNLFALMNCSLYRSNDGIHWNREVDSINGTAFEFVPGVSHQIVVVRGDDGLYGYNTPALYDIAAKKYLLPTETLPQIEAHFKDVQIITADTMLAIGGTNTIIRSSLQGKKWEVLSNFTSHTGFNMDFSTDSVGYTNNYSVLYKTTNAATTWFPYDSSVYGDKNFRKIRSTAVMKSVGYFGIYQDSLETGLLFMPDSATSCSYRPISLPQIGKVSINLYAANGLLFAMYQSVSQDSSYLFISSDRGITWEKIFSDYNHFLSLRTIPALPNAFIIVLKTDTLDTPTFFLTKDRGMTWKQLSFPQYGSLFDMNSDGVGFFKGDSLNHPKVWRTSDFGHTWQILKNRPPIEIWKYIYHEQSKSWITYDGETPRFAVSQDNGDTWSVYVSADLDHLSTERVVDYWSGLRFNNKYAWIDNLCIGPFAFGSPCSTMRGIAPDISLAVENDTPPVEIPTLSSVFPQPATDEVRFNVKAYSGVRSVTIYWFSDNFCGVSKKRVSIVL